MAILTSITQPNAAIGDQFLYDGVYIEIVEILNAANGQYRWQQRPRTYAVANNTSSGLVPAAFLHPNTGSPTLPTSAAQIGQIFVRTGATSPGVYVATDLVGGWGGPITGTGTTNLGVTAAPTSTTITSSTGTSAVINLADNTNAGLLPPGYIHPNSPAATLPTTASRIGQFFLRTGATSPGLYIATDLVGGFAGPFSSSTTNITQVPSPTGVAVNSSNGTGATIGLASDTNAGLLGPGYIHPNSPSATMPTTANRVGQLFIRTGATNPGLYVATDLVGGFAQLNGVSPTNLGVTLTASTNVVTSSTGTSATLNLADATNAGLLGAMFYNQTPSATLPATAARIGQLFLRTGATDPGVYAALNTTGTWVGPLGVQPIDARATLTTSVLPPTATDNNPGVKFRHLSNSTPTTGTAFNLLRWIYTFTDPGMPNNGRVIQIDFTDHAATAPTISDTGGTPLTRLAAGQITGNGQEFSFVANASNDIVLTSAGSINVTFMAQDNGSHSKTIIL